MTITLTCETCGHTGEYRSQALAELHFPRHRCETVIARRERTERRLQRAAAEGVRRDCQCKRAQHQHGTRTAYVVDRCRCRSCRDANTAAERERGRQKLYGRYDKLVDASDVRAHLQELMAAGMGWKRVAAVAGVATGTVYPILYGRHLDDPGHPEHRPPRKQITREVHDKLMAVELDLAGGALVDGTGTARRLQALVALGWSHSRLAVRLGILPTNLGPTIHGTRRATAATERAVRELYAELWNQEPTAANRWEQTGITSAKRYAVRHRWVPPMAWDDDTIDDPEATPFVDEFRERKQRPAIEVVEDLEFLLDQGVTRRQIPARLGLTDSGIDNACRRADRNDLWQRYLRSEQQLRDAS